MNSLTQDEIHSIVSSPSYRTLYNSMRILISLDAHEVLPFLNMVQVRDFLKDPFRFFIRCDDATAAAIFRAIERRQPQDLRAKHANPVEDGQ